jgi:hypothetical protein
LKELSLGEGLPGSSAEGSLATAICAFRWRGGKASGRWASRASIHSWLPQS